jgi:hypothetical protein
LLLFISILQKMNIEVDDLAKLMFLDNTQDARLELSLGGIEHNKDLFYFCLDLFCKGLVFLFGSNNRVELDKLNEEQFGIVRKKMGNAGIDVQLRLYEDIPDDGDRSVNINISHLESLPDNLDIGEYSFVIRTPLLVYNINFVLFHNM